MSDFEDTALTGASRFEGCLYDGGGSAVPRRGVIEIDHGIVLFTESGGGAHEWHTTDIVDVQRVAKEVHLELPAVRSDLPTAKLIVKDPAFLARIDEAQSRHGSTALGSIKRVRRRVGLTGWLVIAAITIPLCYVAYAILMPRLHVLVPADKEVALGEMVYEQVSSKWDIRPQEAFDALAARMVAELSDPASPYEIRVTLVEEDQVNAMALPGGRIVVFSGLITTAPSADALAGVLAHEIAHVEERHSLKHILRSLGLIQFAGAAVGGGIDGFEAAETFVEASSGLLILKNSRGHEREADDVAIRKLLRANRNPLGLVQFFESMQESMSHEGSALRWMSTHPLTSDRIRHVREAVQMKAAQRLNSEPWMTPDEWSQFQRLFE